jgi:hypothetical protein
MILINGDVAEKIKQLKKEDIATWQNLVSVPSGRRPQLAGEDTLVAQHADRRARDLDKVP